MLRPESSRPIKHMWSLKQSLSVVCAVPLKERKHLYEKDNLGGLRAAAKAQRIASIDPDKGAIFEQVDLETQLETGLFHAGHVAL